MITEEGNLIEYHADDFGMFYQQSRRILEAVDEGPVNAISIIVTGDELDDCIGLIGGRNIKIALHINLVDGMAVAYRESGCDSALTQNGRFRVSFTKLLCASYIPFIRRKYRDAIRDEITAQISIFRQRFSGNLRIDSHSHFHMIPVVFDALIEVLEENELGAEYIRFPAEPVLPGDIRPINLIKVIVLRVLCARNRIKHAAALRDLERKEFFGVLHSGNMNKEVVCNILSFAEKHSKHDCEILFHPGGCFEQADLDRIDYHADRGFFSSDNRNVELNTLKALNKELKNVGSYKNN